MEHHPHWSATLLSKGLAWVLALFGVEVQDPAHLVGNDVGMSVVVVLVMMAFVLWLKPRLSVERPGVAQQCVELVLTNPMNLGIRDLLDSNVGHHGRQYLPLVGTITLFILVSNSISLIPAFESPTLHPTVPLACALLTFIYYHAVGLRHVGARHYAAHFVGPVAWLAPLMIPVEIISHSARILSLTVRLFANIFASELLYFSFLGVLLVPTARLLETAPVWAVVVGVFTATLPVAFVLLHAFVAVMQAFVFTILPSIYIGMATAEEH